MTAFIKDKHGIHAIRRQDNEFCLEPGFFEIDGKKNRLQNFNLWINIFDEAHPDLPPYFYSRGLNEKEALPGPGLIRFGADCTLFQESQPEAKRMMPGGTPLTYKTIPGDPFWNTDDACTYEIRPADGSEDFICRLSTRYIQVKEGDFLDLKGEWFPETMIAYSDAILGVPYMLGYAFFTGTFRGKKVTAIGGVDSTFGSGFADIINLFQESAFVGLGFAAVNRDASREWGILYWSKGKSLCFYGNDRQQTKISTNVSVRDMVWEEVPYLGDDTVTFPQATFEVPDQDLVFHYRAKYGRSGQEAKPAASPGQIQSAGSWYEEKNQKERKYSFTFGESIGALGKMHLDDRGNRRAAS